MNSLKKALTTIGLSCVVVATTQAQGLVNFTSSTQNTTTNNTMAALGATASGKIQGAGNYYFCLLYSPPPPRLRLKLVMPMSMLSTAIMPLRLMAGRW